MNILYKMKNEAKYEALKKFFSENFSTTTDIQNRLHTKDIVTIAFENKFSFSDGKIAEVFKNMNLGEHRTKCNINKKIQSGYYYLIYKT